MNVTPDYDTPSGLARERFHRLPPRVVNGLVRGGFRSWEQVAAATDEDLLRYGVIGPKGLAAIRQEQRFQRV